jgi:FAD/FMN-containing dehydrogenase
MACVQAPSRLAWLAAELAARRGALPRVSLSELERAGYVGREGPPQFRTNFGKTFRLRPPLWARPRNVAELQRIVAYACQEHIPIKPIGSLCTWSPAARPDDSGIALLTDRLTGVSEPERALLWPHRVPRRTAEPPPLAVHDIVNARHLIRAAAGTTILALCRALRERRLAIKTMGAFGGERLGGAFSTGTHGSSVFFGPMCDSVVSMDVVWQGVLVRLEPSAGPTDPGRFQRDPERRAWLLVQDDELFHAARIGYGMTGVAASYLIEVAPLYFLEERREDIGHAALRAAIRDAANGAPGNSFERALSAEYYYNLFAGQNRRGIRVERRLVPPVACPDAPRRTLDEWIFRTLRRLRIDPGRLFTRLFRALPRRVPGILEQGLAGLEGTRSGYPDCVYNMGEANYVGTTVQEIAVPAPAIDAYLDDCEAEARRLFEAEGRALTAPIGVRFVRPSRAALAIQQPFVLGEDGRRIPVRLWAMVNFTLTIGTPHGAEILERFQRLARRYSGRCHVGKTCFDGPAEWRRCYDLERFCEIRAAIDPEGCFLNDWNRALLAPAVSLARPPAPRRSNGAPACVRS